MNQIRSGIKVTLNFDATSYSKIEGDWPCLILIFSDKYWFPQQALSFVYEDCIEITMIVENCNQLDGNINAE